VTRHRARTVLVTGANRGLGLATATELHRRGWRVVVAARNGTDAEEAAERIGGGARGFTLDITDAASVAAAPGELGTVDALVNNAGVLLDDGADVLAVSPDLIRSTMAVNFFGTWQVCQAFLPAMIARGWGRVVLVSSGTGTFTHGPFGGTPAYSLSKTAVNGLTVLLAARTAGTGVLVNAVNPGRVRTRMMPSAEQSPETAGAEVADLVTLPDDGPSGVLLRSGRVSGW